MRVVTYMKYGVIPLVVLNNTTIAFVLLKHNHWRQRSSTVFMVLMAITDIFGVICRNLEFDFTDVKYCIVDGLTNFGTIFPVWMQVGLVTERAIVVSFPIKGRFLLSRRNVAITSAIIFILVIFLSFLPNILDVHMEHCSYSKGYEYLATVMSVIYFDVPFMWTVFCNSIIVWHLKQKNESRHSENAQNVANSVVRIALVFSITFFMFTAPLSIFNKIFKFDSMQTTVHVNEGYQSKYFVFQILQLVSQLFHAANIILYIVSSKTFRNDLIQNIRFIVSCIC